MTNDVVALVRHAPDVRTVVEGMIAFGEQVEPREAEGGITLLYDPQDRLMVSIEVPLLVNVPGEVERLLGREMSGRVPIPVWWVEIRATAGLSDAGRIARRFADDMVHWQGGTVWTSRPEPEPGGPP